MRLLIISAYFWPESTGTAPYTTAMARHLAKTGHQVDVIAAHPHYPAWRPLRGRLGLREELDGIVVRRIPHYIPRAPSASKRAVYEASMTLAFTAVLPTTPPADAVLGVIPALSSGLVARIAHRYHRCPYGLLIHDLMGKAAEQSGVEGGRRVANLVAKAEMYAAKRASRIGIVADAFRPSFEAAGIPSDRVERLRTWCLGGVAERGSNRVSFGWETNEFICLHAGNMGFKQDLNNLLDAAAEANDSVRFVLAGDGSERARLRRRQVEERIHRAAFLEPQPAGRYEQMLESADILLINQRSSVDEMSLPSKLTAYFAAGRPIVAAVPAGSETASEVEAAGAGIVVPPGKPEALINAILELRSDPHRREAFGRNGREFASTHLTAESVLPSYESFVERIGERS
jgi:putative colanic acid biosynthesis glycosyltransferase WcaI